LHVLYTYDDGTVSVDNLTNDQTAGGISVAPQGVRQQVLHPGVPAATTPPATSQSYFVELLLTRDGRVIDRNVYWLSTQQDVVDWPATLFGDYPQATMSQYADLSQLQHLAPAAVHLTARSHPVWDAGDSSEETDVTITNVSSKPTVAFFLRADVRRGSATGVPASDDNEIVPIIWSDNDVTLWPGESETLRATYRRSELHGAAPVLSVSGWNVAAEDVPAGS
jgi:exo-1,4-beta-D-glucosaminidase